MPETAFYGARASTTIMGIEPPQPVQEDASEKTLNAKTDIPSASDTEAASISTIPSSFKDHTLLARAFKDSSSSLHSLAGKAHLTSHKFTVYPQTKHSSLFGTYFCGPLADQIATFYTERNNRIREPEMRLPVALLAALFTFVIKGRKNLDSGEEFV